MDEAEPDDTLAIRLSQEQAGLIVFALMERSRYATDVQEQIGLARLAIGLNDLMVEEEDHAE